MEEEEEEDVSQDDSESKSDEVECAADGQTGKVVSSITIGLGCEKGKHRSVAVVERLLRDESLRAVAIRGRGQPVVLVEVEVSARHRDINRTGKDARRCGGKGRQRAEARHRRKRGGHMNEDDEEEWS